MPVRRCGARRPQSVRLRCDGLLLQLGDPLQPIVNAARGMVFALLADIVNDPGQFPRAKTDYAVTHLPLQHLAAQLQLFVDLVRRCAFDLSDELADRQRGRNGYGHVYMGFGAAYFMHKHSRSLDDSVADFAMRQRFDGRRQQR